jgi:conjugative relaxase-like TrwC/TraI family protein
MAEGRFAGSGRMLSLGKLGAGQQSYYLEAVANGVEDYYSGRGEVAGRWVGAGAETLALSGVVDGDALRAVLEGRDPDTGVPLGRIRSDHVPGFDLTFRAPKSVSVLFGLSGFEISAQVRSAHDSAVDAALGYLERSACWSRRGADGVHQVSGGGFVGAAFRHRSSRAGDPHLHTHVLVANMTHGPDRRWATLDGRHLYLHAKTAGYLYEAHLRLELTHRLGVRWGPVVNGIADLEGIPDAMLRAFSTRRVEIEAALAQRGASSARAAEIAALDTRKAKDYGISTGAMTERWRTRAAELGVEADAMDAVVGRTYPGLVVRGEIDRTIEALVGRDGLTAHSSSFDRRDVLRAWCEHFTGGAPVTRIEQFADETIAAPQIVPLRAVETASLHKRWSGRRIQAPAVTSYSTADLLALERRVIDRAVADRGDDIAIAIADEDAVRNALRARPELSEEQTALVTRLTTNGHAVDVVVAAAGTGKTFALDGARDAWQHSGWRVIGTALAARAAAELEASAGIPSQTIASFLADLDNPNHGGLPPDAVVIVDEAGMVGTRTLARLIDHAAAVRAKVVLVGDPRQLPEIEAGGLLRGLARRLEPIGLSQNRRQRDEWEREALRALRAGNVEVALGAYDAHERVVTAPTADGTRELMVADWWAGSLRDVNVLMVAARHYDVDDLNARARAHRQTAGELTGPTLELDGRPYQSGDRVMTLRNQRRLGVRNGSFATIAAVDTEQREMTIRTDQATTHQLPTAYLDAGHVRHAYATTIHKAQGITVDQALVLGNDTLYQEAGYVALSRGRKDNRIYLVEQPEREQRTPEPIPAPLDTLSAALRVSHAQELAVDRGINVKALERRMLDADLHQLCDERKDLERIARMKPHNPAADIDSLEHGRRQLANALWSQQFRLNELTGGQLIRRRRERTAERLSVEQAVENLHRQLDSTDQALGVARGQQGAYYKYANKYGKQLVRLDRIGYEIEAKLERLVTGYRDDPPAYLATLGPYPYDGNKRWRWDDAAHSVEQYRHQHHVTDQHQSLGPTRQHDHEQRHARERLQQASRELTQNVGRESPGLEIEL